MEINRVVKAEGGFKVNDQFFIPEDENNFDYKDVIEWINSGGIVEDQFSSEELLNRAKSTKIAEISFQKDKNLKQSIQFEIDGENHYFQRDIISQLGWVNIIENHEDIVVELWVTANNKFVSLTKSNLLSICYLIRQRDTEEVFQSRKRKDKVLSFLTLEQVENFDITQNFQ